MGTSPLGTASVTGETRGLWVSLEPVAVVFLLAKPWKSATFIFPMVKSPYSWNEWKTWELSHENFLSTTSWCVAPLRDQIFFSFGLANESNKTNQVRLFLLWSWWPKRLSINCQDFIFDGYATSPMPMSMKVQSGFTEILMVAPRKVRRGSRVYRRSRFLTYFS